MADNSTLLANSTTPVEDLSPHFRDASRFWIQRIFVPLVVGIGLLGNVVTIVVLTRRRMRSSTNVYLTALAVSDLLYLLFVFSLSLKHYPSINEPRYHWYWDYYGFGIWFTDATCYTSIWLTVSFTIERYIAVCHPMRGRLLCTESRARKVIVLVYLFCFLTTISTPLEYKAVLTSNEKGKLIATYNLTSLAYDATYRNVFYWYTTIIFVTVPLVLLGIFNSFLIHAVRRSQQQRCRMTQVEQCDSVQTQENKITITLIAVVILFMVCQIPSAIVLIYELFHEPGNPTERNIMLGLGNIFNFLVTINAACNFVLYCALSDKYRRTFLVTFLPSCCYHPPTPSRQNTRFSSMYDGPSTLRRSVRVSSVRVSTTNCDNGKEFNLNSDRKTSESAQQSFPMMQQAVVNNVAPPIVESLRDKLLPFQSSSKPACELRHSQG